MRQDDRRPEPTDPDHQLNRQQRRAARFRPLAGKPDPHAVGEPATDETTRADVEPAADDHPAAISDEPVAKPG